MKTKTKFLLFASLLITSLVWLIAYTYPDPQLKIIACDVGQGDASLIIYQNTQILIDGGPDRSVIDCLSNYIPFWDREIELVILTHPQKDHFGGLIDVFQNYEVENFLANSLDSSSQEYQVLQKAVGGSNTRVLNPTSGLSIGLGMIHLDIFWPTKMFMANKNVSFDSNVLGASTSSTDANEFSVVAIVRLGDYSALFTGDIQPPAINGLVEELQRSGIDDVDYIKIPHHGSKNGITEKLLDQVNPEVAVISVGKNNSYGHPHAEVLMMLEERRVEILRTDEMGNVIIKD